MATATADKTTATEDILLALADQHRPVNEILPAGDAKAQFALAQAWARGDVEFGRACHCVTGRPGVPESKPTLIIEDGIDWTGPKTQRHKRLSGLLADAAKVPECTEYKKYVKQIMIGKDDQGVERWRTVESIEDGQEYRWTTQKINRAEAVALMTLYVRLTDKGLSALQVS